MRTLVGLMRRDLEDMKAVLFLRAPFLSLLLSKIRLVLDTRINMVAATSAGEVVVNPFFWSGLKGTQTKAFVLLHEALHLAFGHPWQVVGKDPDLWNMATDMVVNEMLYRHGYNQAPVRPITAEVVYEHLRHKAKFETAIDLLRQASAGEVYRLLTEAAEAEAVRCLQGFPHDILEHEPDPEGQVVQDGGLKDGEDPQTYWRTAVAEAWVTAQQAGVMPAGLARVVEDFLRPQLDWRRHLRGCLQEGIGPAVVTTWQRPSRRYKYCPGIKTLGIKTVWVLVDCSGSVGDQDLDKFLAELGALAQVYACILKVVPWDVQAYPAVAANSACQVRRRAGPILRGGGGNVLAPVLRQVVRDVAAQDVVVILTDGHIADLKGEETMRLYMRLTKRAARMIFVTTDADPHLPHTKLILMK